MTVLDWPAVAPGFSKFSMKGMDKTTAMISPFTGKGQFNKYPYDLWQVKGDLAQCVGQNAAIMRSFLRQLGGRSGKFRLPIPTSVSWNAVSGANPITGYTTNGGFLTANFAAGITSITTTLWSASTWVLADGDYFTINDELKIVIGDVVSDSSGNATINFYPPLRSATSYGNGGQIKFGFQRNIVRFSDDLSAPDWIKQNSSVTNATDFQGSVNIPCRFTKVGSNAVIGRIYELISPTFYGANRTFTLSGYAKAGTYSGQIIIFLGDFINFIACAVVVTLTGSYVRFSVTATINFDFGNQLSFLIQEGNGSTHPMNNGDYFDISGLQLEESSNLTTYDYTQSGGGVPSVLLQMDADGPSSWDITPPFEHTISISAIEAFDNS
jgi:hypothetical protein